MSKKAPVSLRVSCVLAVMVVSISTGLFITGSISQQSSFQNPIKLANSDALININESINLDEAVYQFSNSSTYARSFVSTSPQPAVKEQQNVSNRLVYSFIDYTERNLIAQSTLANDDDVGIIDAASPDKNDLLTIDMTNYLKALTFATYTYGGYSVQQSNQNKLFFTFPESTNQGKLSGSDAISLSKQPLKTMSFDAIFNTPNVNALGFDEMVIFAASDTTSYKGIEFGLRLGLSDGLIYGYVQEPNGYGDVNFQMIQLAPNDGASHHFTLTVLGTIVTFTMDDINYGSINFQSQNDYANLDFYVLAVVHRFTDYWNSEGDNMTIENLTVN